MVLQLTNTFKQIADEIPGIAEYHFGYHSDVNTATDNIYNPGGALGRGFPLCLLVAPLSAAVKPETKTGSLVYDVEVFFYDTQNYTNEGAQRTETMAEVWQRLEKMALTFLHSVKETRLSIEEIQILHDAHAHNAQLCAVGLTFKVTMKYGCDDYFTEGVTSVNPGIDNTELEYGS